MNSILLGVFEQYQSVFMDRIAEKFDVPRDQMSEIWEEVRKTKLHKTKKAKKQTIPSAYVLFCRAKREGLKDMDFGQISKELGRMWKNASEEEKALYVAENDRLRKEKVSPPPPSPPSEVDVNMMTTQVEEEEETLVAPEKDIEKKAEKKAPRKKDKEDIPADMEEEAERELWRELSKFKLPELRIHCTNSSLKPSKTREEMIRALVHYRMALANHDDSQNNNKALRDRDESDEEEEDEDEVEW